MHALLTIWSVEVSPPFITVKIGDRQDALLHVPRALFCRKSSLRIEWPALTPGPSWSLQALRQMFFQHRREASVRHMKIVPGDGVKSSHFATNSHSGSELPF